MQSNFLKTILRTAALTGVLLFAGATMGYSQPISQVLREDLQKLRPIHVSD